jgi:OmpA family protein
MKRYTNRVSAAVATTILAIGCTAALAQTSKTFVYPQKGQSADQQAKDEAECRTSAKGQSGVNPDAAPAPAQVGSHARGAAGGAAKGAAAGAAVGAIAGDAGKGAAAGAVVGGVAGRRQSKKGQQAQQAEATDSFQRAFGACMEARGYSVK